MLDFYERKEWNIKKAKPFASELKTRPFKKKKDRKENNYKMLGLSFNRNKISV